MSRFDSALGRTFALVAIFVISCSIVHHMILTLPACIFNLELQSTIIYIGIIRLLSAKVANYK